MDCPMSQSFSFLAYHVSPFLVADILARGMRLGICFIGGVPPVFILCSTKLVEPMSEDDQEKLDLFSHNRVASICLSFTLTLP